MSIYKHDSTLVLAHYYTTPEVQQLADFVGDSLDLALKAVNEKPKRIVFAGVRFMAETAKILNPDTEVILPDSGSSCSLVEQTNIEQLKDWVAKHKADGERNNKQVTHVAYINSSAEHKTTADIIVTSRIVADVIQRLDENKHLILFSPDYNMGAWLNYELGLSMPKWSAVCEVHDKFKIDELENEWKKWTDGKKYLIAHPESILPILKRADYVGSTHGMLNWIKEHPYKHSTIYVATEEGLLHNMKKLRPELDIRQAPIYTGCQCNVCPYMKLNTPLKVMYAVNVGIGTKINYMSDSLMEQARIPIDRMMYYQQTGEIKFN